MHSHRLGYCPRMTGQSCLDRLGYFEVVSLYSLEPEVLNWKNVTLQIQRQYAVELQTRRKISQRRLTVDGGSGLAFP